MFNFKSNPYHKSSSFFNILILFFISFISNKHKQFHGGYNETILFSQWKTESVEGLIGSMVFIFIMAALYEGLKYYREFLFWKTYNALQYRAVSVPEKNVVASEENARVVQ